MPSRKRRTPTATLRRRDFRRILLVKPSAVGDVIHTLPVLARLRARYPDARIDWLLTPGIAEWVRHHPALSGVVSFPRKELADFWRSGAALAGLVRLLCDIRRANYDLVIDLHGQFRSAVFCLASGAAVRIGFDRPRRSVRRASARRLPEEAYAHGWTGAREGSWLAYTHRIPVPTLDVHAVDRYLRVGELLGFEPGPPDFRLPIPEASRRRVDSLLGAVGESDRPLAVLVPGTQWETKHWHAGGFAEVAGHLLGRGWAVALAGSEGDRPRCAAVARACHARRDAGPTGVIDLCGQTALSELAALVGRAAVCVSNDSGAMHLAVALGRPVVSVFGPTDPLWVGPYGRPGAVVRAGLGCSPCYLRRVDRCPHGHACMGGVSAREVIGRVEAVLAGRCA